jgi:hypothetical protein
MSKSSTPRLLISVVTRSQNLAPSIARRRSIRFAKRTRVATRGGCLFYPHAQHLLAAVAADAEGHVDRLVPDRPLVPHLDPERVEEHQGIERLERPALPFGDLVQHGVGHRADQVGGDVEAIEIGQVPLNLPHGQATGVHRHDLVVETR